MSGFDNSSFSDWTGSDEHRKKVAEENRKRWATVTNWQIARKITVTILVLVSLGLGLKWAYHKGQADQQAELRSATHSLSVSGD
jgi:hypothetical protein